MDSFYTRVSRIWPSRLNTIPNMKWIKPVDKYIRVSVIGIITFAIIESISYLVGQKLVEKGLFFDPFFIKESFIGYKTRVKSNLGWDSVDQIRAAPFDFGSQKPCLEKHLVFITDAIDRRSRYAIALR